MPQLLPNPLFNSYEFSDEEKEQLKHLVKSPILQAYIQHIVSLEVQQHLLMEITKIGDQNLRDQEMFTKGVIQVGLTLLEGDV